MIGCIAINYMNYFMVHNTNRDFNIGLLFWESSMIWLNNSSLLIVHFTFLDSHNIASCC